MQEYKTEFGKLVHQLLTERNLTQTKVCELAGLQVHALNRLMTGNSFRKPTESWAHSICRALELSEDDSRKLYLAVARDRGYKL